MVPSDPTLSIRAVYVGGLPVLHRTVRVPAFSHPHVLDATPKPQPPKRGRTGIFLTHPPLRLTPAQPPAD